MHDVQIRQEIVDRVMARRGKLHWFEQFDPARTALIVIDMQNTFCEPGSPAEVAVSRSIVPNINRLAGELRGRGGRVVWVLHANSHWGDRTDWELFFNNVVSDDVKLRTAASLAPGKQQVWSGLATAPDDITIIKNRYSALIQGSSSLERVLRNLGIDTVLIAGTKTNVCCEATGRDAMMLDFRTVIVSDCCAALSDDEHRATLETFIQQFGDVLSSDEVVRRMR
ncbi:isochorismatase [Rhizorhabdus wittichii DC-6]|uniref:Isochorismatase hydrolase n=1 Tax=Rhizorhabdus wittichii (strain DSM 6014 / CCUG 31198 / JCM 15750 / NBRC 105917 / EY 4224 / RW1) TaxID=392499 RepID=A0A9J9HBE2_RHIWR|nr:isochorismatase hydrolase [Rhizorhabdus wittichii RW1]ARR54706.1 isochorismatase [Rhizorhabdus wittichii DC-6]